MREISEIIGTILAVVAVVWVCFRLSLFLYERDIVTPRNDKVEIQTLFHGNTKDQDQI
jgi:hypothetical protein